MLVTSCTSVNFFSCLLHFNSLAVFQFFYKNSLCKIHTNVSAVNTLTGWTDAEAETPILWPPDVKNRLTGKDPDAGKY